MSNTPANTTDQVAEPQTPEKPTDPREGMKQVGVIVHGHLNLAHYVAEAQSAGMKAVAGEGYTELLVPDKTPSPAAPRKD